MITFGKNIQKRRINLGLDTNDLAKLANYPNRSYIEKIESDKMYPSTKKIPDLAKALSWEIEDIENNFIFIKNMLKSIKSYQENETPRRTIIFSLDACKKHYLSLFDKYIREDFLSKINNLVIKNYYENNVELEKIEAFFKEKEYEICLIGLCDLLETILKLKEISKDTEDVIDAEEVIILDDFLRI